MSRRKEFSELNKDGRVAVMYALATPELAAFNRAQLDLSLVPEEEVLKLISWCRNTHLGDNFKKFLLASLRRIAEEAVRQLEANVAAGETNFAVVKMSIPGVSSKPGYFFNDEVQVTYGLNKAEWKCLKGQIGGFRLWVEELTGEELSDDRNRRWLAAWLGISRANSSDIATELETWLREQAMSGNSFRAPYAQRILGEFYCPRCGNRTEDDLFDAGLWFCCPACEEDIDRKGRNWCPTCLFDTYPPEKCQCV